MEHSKLYILGWTCSRCKHQTPIFSGVERSGASLLPVTGTFSYPCEACDWPMECDIDKLEELSVQAGQEKQE